VSGHDRFDIPLRARSALLTAEDLQQHRHPLGRGQAGINGKMPAERTGQQPNPVAGLEQAPRKLDGPIALAATDILDYGVGHLCRLQPVHHQADDAGTPAGGVPLQLDRDEGVPGEQRNFAVLATAADGPPLTQFGA
jgi:hypothetical protein